MKRPIGNKMDILSSQMRFWDNQKPLHLSSVSCLKFILRPSQDYLSWGNKSTTPPILVGKLHCLPRINGVLLPHLPKKHNPGKTVKVSQGRELPPGGPFLHWKWDFIQLPKSPGSEYFLTVICMFSHWLDASPCKRVTVTTVTIFLLKEFSSLRVFTCLLKWT